MMPWLYAICLTLGFTFASGAQALTLQECVKLVSENNPELQAARENLKSTEELYDSSKSGFLPTLSGSINAVHNYPNSSIGRAGTKGVAYSSSLSMDYNLFSGFKDVGTLEKARATLAIQKASLDTTRASVSDKLRQAFLKLRYAEANIKLTAQIVERRGQNERLVRAQYEGGHENQGSYLLAQSKLEQAKFDALQASHQLVEARETLGHVLGLEPQELKVSGNVPSDNPPEQVDLHELVTLTPTHRSEEAQIAVSRANIKISKSGFLPSLDLTGSVQNPNRVLYTNSDQEWTVGLTLSIPLFSGLSSYHNTKSSLALERAATRTEVASDYTNYDLLRQSLFAFQESAQKLRVDQSTLNAIEVQERISRKQYNNGLVSFESWDIIEGNLVTSQKTALSSERDRAIAESTWRLNQGLGDLP